MTPDHINSETKRILSQYLSSLDFDVLTLGSACLVTRAAPRYGLPADAVVKRLLITEPDQGWSVAIEGVARGGAIWRMRVQHYYDDGDRLGPGGAQAAYCDWLHSL